MKENILIDVSVSNTTFNHLVLTNETFIRLKQHAEPFQSLDSVLNNLMNAVESYQQVDEYPVVFPKTIIHMRPCWITVDNDGRQDVTEWAQLLGIMLKMAYKKANGNNDVFKSYIDLTVFENKVGIAYKMILLNPKLTIYVRYPCANIAWKSVQRIANNLNITIECGFEWLPPSGKIGKGRIVTRK